MKQLEKLSTKHKELALWLVEHPFATLTQAEKEFKWCHSLMSQIYNSKVFQDYVDELLKNKWKGLTKKAVKVMDQLLDNGEYNAAKYVLDSSGYLPKQLVEISTEDTIKIKIE